MSEYFDTEPLRPPWPANLSDLTLRQLQEMAETFLQARPPPLEDPQREMEGVLDTGLLRDMRDEITPSSDPLWTGSRWGIVRGAEAVVWLQTLGVARWVLREDYLVAWYREGSPQDAFILVPDGCFWTISMRAPAVCLGGTESMGLLGATVWGIPPRLWEAYKMGALRGAPSLPLLGGASRHSHALNGGLGHPCLGGNPLRIATSWPMAKVAVSAFGVATPELNGSIRLRRPLPERWIDWAVEACLKVWEMPAGMKYYDRMSVTSHYIRETCPILVLHPLEEGGKDKAYTVSLHRRKETEESVPWFQEVDDERAPCAQPVEEWYGVECPVCGDRAAESLMFSCDECSEECCELCGSDHECTPPVNCANSECGATLPTEDDQQFCPRCSYGPVCEICATACCSCADCGAPRDTFLECGVCGHVYCPCMGHRISEPHTTFRCPQCFGRCFACGEVAEGSLLLLCRCGLEYCRGCSCPTCNQRCEVCYTRVPSWETRSPIECPCGCGQYVCSWCGVESHQRTPYSNMAEA